MFGKLFLIPFTNPLIEKYGMKKINFLATLLIFLGNLSKCQIVLSYNFVHFGLLLDGIASNFLTA